jgi:uncharacterized membrane protein
MLLRNLRLIAIVAALVGLADAVYLTVHHYTEDPVPCSVIAGCEQVLTSSYAEVLGIPLAGFGAAAYFTAFSLALLSLYGNRIAWQLFGIQVTLMTIFAAWLIYVQGFVIGAFCQFCLLSALTTLILFTTFVVSVAAGRRNEST